MFEFFGLLLSVVDRVKLRTFIVVSNSGTKGATKSQMESVLPSQSPVPLDPANLFGLLNLNNFKADIGCALTLLMVWLVFIIAREIFSPLRKIPGPPGLPFVGQMFTFLRSKDHIELLSQWAHEYGPVFTYRSRFLGKTVPHILQTVSILSYVVGYNL